MTIWTIGHSTRPIEEFIELLRINAIDVVADVRRFPASRWWRCHRSLIADVLTSIGIQVMHIMDSTTTTQHRYTSPARIVDGVLTYASEASEDPHQLEISLLT